MNKKLSHKNYGQKGYRESGQVLLLVVVTMTIALALGVGVSLETLRSIANISDADTSLRVQSSAEGYAEKVLSLTDADLAGFDSSKCSGLGGSWSGSQCTFSDSAVGAVASGAKDNLVATASVKVEKFKFTDTTNGIYEFSMEPNSTKDIFLSDGSGSYAGKLAVCWKGHPNVKFHLYNSDGDAKKGVAVCRTGCSATISVSSAARVNTRAGTGPLHDYNACFRLDASDVSNAKGLRLTPLSTNNTKIDMAIKPSDTASFVNQGYRIASTGVLQQDNTVKKHVVVYKSFVYAPSFLEYSLYADDVLGN